MQNRGRWATYWLSEEQFKAIPQIALPDRRGPGLMVCNASLLWGESVPRVSGEAIYGRPPTGKTTSPYSNYAVVMWVYEAPSPRHDVVGIIHSVQYYKIIAASSITYEKVCGSTIKPLLSGWKEPKDERLLDEFLSSLKAAVTLSATFSNVGHPGDFYSGMSRVYGFTHRNREVVELAERVGYPARHATRIKDALNAKMYQVEKKSAVALKALGTKIDRTRMRARVWDAVHALLIFSFNTDVSNDLSMRTFDYSERMLFLMLAVAEFNLYLNGWVPLLNGNWVHIKDLA